LPLEAVPRTRPLKTFLYLVRDGSNFGITYNIRKFYLRP